VNNGTSPWFATFARRVVAGVCVSVAVAAASLLPANGVASASTLKRSAFCAAEAYVASNALGGNISPSEEWKTVAQEKTTIATLDRDLKRAVKDAPTKAFAKVAEPLEGTFSLVLDSPRLTKEVFKFETSTSGARSLNAPKLLARMTLMGEVTQSGDYVWAVNAACPNMTILNNDRDPFGNPPKFEATPTEVKATDEARSTMWESETPTKASFNPPTVASLRAAVARVNSRFPADDIVLVGFPKLSRGTWHAMYRVTANSERFSVFLTLSNSVNGIEAVEGSRVLNVVALAS
jgi:hypothetical protein